MIDYRVIRNLRKVFYMKVRDKIKYLVLGEKKEQKRKRNNVENRRKFEKIYN